jgi:hypothetical protein
VAKARPTVHHTDRGGGYNMPLMLRRISTRPPEIVVIGGEPPSKEWKARGLRLVDAAEAARFAANVKDASPRAVAGAHAAYRVQAGGPDERAYVQHTDAWTEERREVFLEGAAAPMVVSYGHVTRYVAYYWSAEPNAQAAANESKIRAANRDLEASGAAPALAEPVALPAADLIVREDPDGGTVPGASEPTDDAATG